MVKYYSHSKIGTFEKCPLKFKFRYIDKIPTDVRTIEAHLGTVVHSTLEWLYGQVKDGKKIPDISEVISYYTETWKKHYSPEIKIIRIDQTLEDYFGKGVQFILEYYAKHYPFDENTLELEKRIVIKLSEEYLIQGYIDRLSHNKETNEFEIHDYKTANRFPDKEAVENDTQLALYSIAIKELFGYDKKVCLIWHYLAHNKKICIRKTNEQLDTLKEETLKKINDIENAKNFPPYISKLCEWCEYNEMCPAWKKN